MPTAPVGQPPPLGTGRLAAQLLAGTPGPGPLEVVERLLAVQAQDPRGAYLALRARSDDLSVADVDRAVAADRALLVTWLNRGTLHLVRREDYPWLHALSAPRLVTGCMRRLGQEGVSPEHADRAVRLIGRMLDDDGPLRRDVLRERLADAGIRVQGQAFVHLLFLASIRGLIVRLPALRGQPEFALTREWLGAVAPVDRDAALGELARRYLAGHGPADAADLARWAGLPKRDAHAGLSAIAGELSIRPDGLLDLAGRAPYEAPPRPRLLGPFEPVLLGWASRDWLVGGHERRMVKGGVFSAFALVRGQAAATWTLAGGTLRLEAFAELDSGERRALEADARELARFLAGGRDPAPEPGRRGQPEGLPPQATHRSA